MHQKIKNREWFTCAPRVIEGVNVYPYVVADSAFALQTTCLKPYENNETVSYRRSFNYIVIRTRRVVEQAFGRLKGRWKIMHGNCKLNDPVFARQVAMVCCALHNICERHQCPFENGWLPDESALVSTAPTRRSVISESASSVQEAVAKHVHRYRPVPL